MNHIDTVHYTVYANAFDHVHRNVRTAHTERQILHAEPIPIQEECRQVDMLQPIAAVHGVGSSGAVNACRRILSGRILLVLVEQFHLEQTTIRCVVVCLVIIVVQLFRCGAALCLQRIVSLEVDQIAHDGGIIRLAVDFLIRVIIRGNAGLGSIFAVHILICLVDGIRLALYQNIPGILVVIICLFLVGQFRRIIPCTRNVVHGHAVVHHKGIFAQNYHILAAVCF